MKTINILLAIGFGTVWQATAAPLPQNASAAHAVNTNAILSKLESFQPAAKGKVEIYRAGKMSSRPWTEIVGWRPGVSQFPDAEHHEPGLTLVSVSFGPQNRQPPAISKRSPQP